MGNGWAMGMPRLSEHDSEMKISSWSPPLIVSGERLGEVSVPGTDASLHTKARPLQHRTTSGVKEAFLLLSLIPELLAFLSALPNETTYL